jgi:LPS-assembly protein
LLAGAAAWSFLCALSLSRSAEAQPLPPGPADQAVGSDGFYMEADTMIRDDAHHTWVAKGSVEARYQGKVLRADELDFNQENGVVTALGDVQLLSPDGTSEFAKSMTLDQDFKAGVALAFSTRQQPNTKIVADEALRLNRDSMALNKAVFTVCDICAADGEPETPTWAIEADQVIQDHEHNLIFYKHAVIRLKGLPVIYTPLFWHTDPTAKRGSGLLGPAMGTDVRRGLFFEQPYLWVISPYADVVIDPQFNSRVSPLLMTEYRERFYSGQIDVRAGYAYAQQFDATGKPYDYLTNRSYILARGAFAPVKDWAWGFSAERVTDPLMLQRYTVPNVYDPRGLMVTDDGRLISQLYAVEQNSKSYLSIAAMSFQGLNPGDQNGTFPIVAPLIEGHYEPDVLFLGGKLHLEGSAVVLERPRNPNTDIAPGEDSRRASIGGDWRTTYTLDQGIRLSPFLNARNDIYNVDNVSATDTGLHTTDRPLGTAGLDASWPFFRRTGDLTTVIEPLAQLAVSPRAVTNPYIPNEDSQIIGFDETNLFEADKSEGFDYYEGGARANVGGRVSFRWDGGAQAQILAGQSFRAAPDPTLPAYTSLNQTESDWVVAASASGMGGLSGFGRALIDSRTDRIRRLEAGLNGSTSWVSGYVSYFHDNIDVTGTDTENASFGGSLHVTKHWSIASSANLDLVNKAAPQESTGLVYQDECIHWELDWVHSGTTNGTLVPSDLVVVRLLLVTLGSSGYQRPDFR